MTEATVLLAALVQRFQFQIVPSRPVVPLASLTLRPRDGLFMHVKPR
jgi:cytochrome P450